jgi:hypothetical protein
LFRRSRPFWARSQARSMNGREHGAPRIGFEGPGGFGISVDDVNMPLDQAHRSQTAGVVASAPPQLTLIAQGPGRLMLCWNRPKRAGGTKRSDNGIHRFHSARVLKFRIHIPPAEGLRTFSPWAADNHAAIDDAVIIKWRAGDPAAVMPILEDWNLGHRPTNAAPPTRA